MTATRVAPKRRLLPATSTWKPTAGWPMGRELTKALAALRRQYQCEVGALAGRLALQFQSHRFDVEKPEEEWEKAPGAPCSTPPFCLLEDLCEALPMCQDPDSARALIAVSEYGEEYPSDPDRWEHAAARCLARDVHDYAFRRGWAQDRGDWE